MFLFIVRHGEASLEAASDEERPLTELGLMQAKVSGQWLHSQVKRSSLIVQQALVSPLLRAQQTFQQIASQVSIQTHETSHDIVPSSNPQFAHDLIDAQVAGYCEHDALLVVSHMPFVSYLTDALCGYPHSMLFATGQVVVISYDKRAMRGQIVSQFIPE